MEKGEVEQTHECYTHDIGIYFYGDSGNDGDKKSPMFHIVGFNNGADFNSIHLHPRQARELIVIIGQALKREVGNKDTECIGQIK